MEFNPAVNDWQGENDENEKELLSLTSVMEEDVSDPSKEMHSSIHRQDADKCLVAMAMR